MWDNVIKQEKMLNMGTPNAYKRLELTRVLCPCHFEGKVRAWG